MTASIAMLALKIMINVWLHGDQWWSVGVADDPAGNQGLRQLPKVTVVLESCDQYPG